MVRRSTRDLALAVAAGLSTALLGIPAAHAMAGGFVGGLPHERVVASTVPRNGDVNPQGVSNVLPGIVHGQPARTSNGDVVRLALDLRGPRPRLIRSTFIADDLAVHTDPAALVIGPTGLALAPDGTLFVADTVNSRIARIGDALLRTTPVDAGAGRDRDSRPCAQRPARPQTLYFVNDDTNTLDVLS